MKASATIMGLLLPLALCAAPALAKGKAPREGRCSWITQTPEGKFRSEPKPFWSLMIAGLNVELKPEERARYSVKQEDVPPQVTGFACQREPAMLVSGDVAFLKAGKVIYLSPAGASATIVKYSMANQRIGYDVTSGVLSPNQKKQIDQALAALPQ